MTEWSSKLVTTFSDLNLEEHDALARFVREAQCSSPFQLPHFNEAVGRGYASSRWYFVARRNGQIEAFGAGVEASALGRRFSRFRSLTFQNGPSLLSPLHTEKCLCELRDAAAKAGISLIRVRPPIEEKSTKELQEILPGGEWLPDTSNPETATMKIDLRLSDEELLAKMKSDTRRRIRRAVNDGIDIRRVKKIHEVADIYEIYYRTATRKGFSAVNSATFHLLAESTLKEIDLGYILSAHIDSKLVGAIFVLISGKTAHYVYGATENSGDLRNQPIAYPLHFKALGIARDMGCYYYDMGGFDKSRASTVSQFKSGFRGDVITLPGGLVSYLTGPARVFIPGMQSLKSRFDQLRKLWLVSSS